MLKTIVEILKEFLNMCIAKDFQYTDHISK